MIRPGAQKLCRFSSLLTAAEALIALVWLQRIATDGKRAIFLGLSPSRLLMAAALAGFLLAAIAGLFNPHPRKFRSKQLLFPYTPPFPTLYLIVAFAAAAILLYTGFVTPETNRAYFERLLPLGLFLILQGVQTGFFAPLILNEQRTAADITEPKADRKLLFYTLVILGAGGLFFTWVRQTRIGLTPDPFDWQPNGMSIHYWQFAAALLFALVFFALSFALRKKLSKPIRDGILFLLVWAVAALIWTAVPSMEVLKHSYFMEITPPNNLPYPASDAAYFGLWSESIQAGLGFKNAVISRQLFVVILAFLQTLAGRDLLIAIDYLTILLALIPACLFLLGSHIHSQGSGLFAAGITILRELNTLAIGPLFGVSNSKMFLSDLPVFLFFLIFLLAALRWFKEPGSRMKALTAGGLLALTGLIRSQFLLLLPLVLLLHFLRRVPIKARWTGALIFTLGTAAVLAPALVRGIILTGGPTLEDSSIHGFEIPRRYSADPDFTPQRLADESSGEFQTRMSGSIIDFVLDEPAYVFHFIANHFSKDLIDAWLVLPDGIPANFTLTEITDPAYQNVESRFLHGALLQKLLLTVLTALGIAAAFRHAGLGGLLPLVLCPAYMLTAAIGRYSGWRFILPADWLFYFYCAVGIFELFAQIRTKLDGPGPEPQPQPQKNARRPVSVPVKAFVFLLILMAGSLPVAVNHLIPRQIHVNSEAENHQMLQTWADGHGEPFRSILWQAEERALVIKNGRVIYPRFFDANQGLTSANPWTVYATRDFGRLGFVLLNEENTNIILPMAQTPVPVPNGADCLVIGSQHPDGYFQAAAVILPDNADPHSAPTVLQP